MNTFYFLVESSKRSSTFLTTTLLLIGDVVILVILVVILLVKMQRYKSTSGNTAGKTQLEISHDNGPLLSTNTTEDIQCRCIKENTRQIQEQCRKTPLVRQTGFSLLTFLYTVRLVSFDFIVEKKNVRYDKWKEKLC